MIQLKCTISDDAFFFRVIIKDLCKELSLEVLKDYGSGEEMLSDFKKGMLEKPDVIFLDINMPGRSEKELLEDLLDEVPEAIIIMISTVSDGHIVNECLELGASNYINKDLDLNSMKDIIISTLKMNGLI